jgi:hypothetical protein
MLALSTGCATQTFTLQGESAELPKEEDMQSFFISGIGQEQKTDAAEVCGGVEKVAKVETHLSFLDGFLGVVSYGIYTPRTAKVFCLK